MFFSFLFNIINKTKSKKGRKKELLVSLTLKLALKKMLVCHHPTAPIQNLPAQQILLLVSKYKFFDIIEH